MDTDKSHGEKDELLNFLTKENTSSSQTLNEARTFHYQQLITKQQQFLSFVIKLGELSLLIGAAIGPVIIVSSKQISQPAYVFIAMLIYLVNGIWTIWKAKDIVEKQLDAFAPGMFHKLELDIYPMQFSANKLIFNPNNQDYIQEYLKNKLSFLENNAEEKVPKRNVDISLDIFTLNFVIASLLLVRTVWPFGTIVYWASFSIVVVFILGLIILGYIQAKERAIKNEYNTRELNKLKRGHVEWQKQNIFKVKNEK